MARRPQGSVRKSPPRLKQGKPKPPGVGRPSPRPKRSKGPVGGPKPKSRISPQPKGLPDKFERFKGKLDRNPTVQGRAMGGQAREGAARAQLQKARKTERQKELMDMLNRLYGKQKIVPKKKPKKEK